MLDYKETSPAHKLNLNRVTFKTIQQKKKEKEKKDVNEYDGVFYKVMISILELMVSCHLLPFIMLLYRLV